MRDYGPSVQFDNPAFVHETAEIFGNARFAEGVSIWPRAVMRAEAHENVVGPYSNIQDFVMVHVGYDHGNHIGAHCSIAHHASLHGCTIGDNCLIGINATIMDGAVIGDNCIIAGHAIVGAGSQIPANSIVAGVPGAVVKSRNNFVDNRINAFSYHFIALAYARGDHRGWASEAYQTARDAERARLEAEMAAMDTD